MTTRSATTQTTAYDSVGVECHRIATNAQTAPNHLLEDLATRILKIGKGTYNFGLIASYSGGHQHQKVSAGGDDELQRLARDFGIARKRSTLWPALNIAPLKALLHFLRTKKRVISKNLPQRLVHILKSSTIWNMTLLPFFSFQEIDRREELRASLAISGSLRRCCSVLTAISTLFRENFRKSSSTVHS